MKRNTTHARSQSAIASDGFTLVEVLVVIAIIGMLVGLLLPAVMSAKNKAKTAVIKADMTEIVNALENFRSSVGNGQYPPDGTNAADLQQFCRAAWPRVAWNSTVKYPNVTPDTALCFWLGGAQDAASNPHFVGFSANPTNPFDYGQSRTPTSLEFDRTRVNLSTTSSNLSSGSGFFYNLYQYFPPNGKDTTSGSYSPYVYFKAVPVPPGSSATVYPIDPAVLKTVGNALPYLDAKSTTNPQAFVNPQSYQLLCPGLDGKYGKTQSGQPLFYPTGTNYDPVNGIDDMTNFTQGATVDNDR
jgi:type II secretion system protein G